MPQSYRVWIAIGVVVAALVVALIAALVFVGAGQRRIGIAGAALATATPLAEEPPTRTPRPTTAPASAGGPQAKATSVSSASSEQSAARPAAPTALSAGAKPTSAALPQPNAAPTAPRAAPLEQQLPAAVTASGEAPASKDDRGAVTSFVAANASDGRLDTAWRVAGDGVGQWLRLSFAAPIAVSEIRLVPGYAKVDPSSGVNRFTQNRRVVRARFEFSDGTGVEWRFEQRPQLQPVPVPNVVTTFVHITILETTEVDTADARDFTPISEVVVVGSAR